MQQEEAGPKVCSVFKILVMALNINDEIVSQY